jgi:hypothetical protein
VLVALQAEVPHTDKMEIIPFLVPLPQLAVVQAQTMYQQALNPAVMAALVVEQEIQLVQVLEIRPLHLHHKEIMAV